MKVKIIIPIYNDWQSVFKLIQNIDLQLNDELVEILIVNDASTEKYEENLKGISKKIVTTEKHIKTLEKLIN